MFKKPQEMIGPRPIPHSAERNIQSMSTGPPRLSKQQFKPSMALLKLPELYSLEYRTPAGEVELSSFSTRSFNFLQQSAVSGFRPRKSKNRVGLEYE